MVRGSSTCCIAEVEGAEPVQPLKERASRGSQQWNRLPREAMQSLSLEDLKT